MSRIDGSGDLHVSGTVYANAVAPATGVIDADRLQQIRKVGTHFDLAIAGTPANMEEIVFVASTAGTVRAFKALLHTDGDATVDVDFDLLKNDVSVLNTTVNVTGSTGDGVVVVGTVDTTTFAADDIFSIQLIATNTTNAAGPFCWAEFEENPS